MNTSGNLAEYLRDQSRKNPDKPVLIYPDKISFSEFDRKVDQLAHGLSDTGIKKGMKVILLATTNTEFFILVFALFRIGTIIVLIDPGVGQRVMNTSLKTIDADVFIGIPTAHLFRLIHKKSFKGIDINITVGNRLFWGGHKLSHLYKNTNEPFKAGEINANDLGGIFFTSGSTGPPKGVMYLNRMFHAQINLFADHYQWSSEEVDLCTFPIIGLFSICLGCTVAIADMNPVQPAQLDPAKVWANLEDFNCTHMFASPMVIRKLNKYANDNSLKLEKIKRIVTAGAPVPVWLLESFRKHLPENARIHTPYGATESLPVSDAEAVDLIRIKQEFPDSDGVCVGKPIGDNEVIIVPISDKPIKGWEPSNELKCNQIGEIAVQGSVVTESYFNTEANKTSKFQDENGRKFHRMGDLGRIDKNGLIWFYGRKNHRVAIENQTLFTIPVEAYYNKLPNIQRSALVGVPSESANISIPVICLEPSKKLSDKERNDLLSQARQLSQSEPMLSSIENFLIHKSFPVDPRHNAKIFREKLQEWASKSI